jgi:hypothetical protein
MRPGNSARTLPFSATARRSPHERDHPGHGYANTGVSSGRLYWENTLDFFGVKNVTVPAAVTVFPNELYQAPRSWAEQAYPNLIYFNEVDEGNHFAAWQEPELFTTEVRAAFKSLRPSGG